MKKWFSVLLILLFFIWPRVQAETYLPPLSKPQTPEEALYDANSLLGAPYFYDKNINQKPLNISLWSERDNLVYGTHWGDYNAGIGEYRYLGETMEGEDFTNVHFPNERLGGRLLGR